VAKKVKVTETQAGHESRSTRNRKQRYSKEVYGARVPHEDARILEDYGKANNLERSDVVRRALHYFALRQQMISPKKDPIREMIEQVVAAQIAPLCNRAEETVAALRQLAELIIQTRQAPAVAGVSNNSDEASARLEEIETSQPPLQALKEQKQLLEKTLMAAMLALRLHVNYIVEPVLQNAEARSDDRAAASLQAAIRGRDAWSEITREVITRTGNRILFELNLITKEDWEELLKTYHNRAV
jgi:hypothetical protein